MLVLNCEIGGDVTLPGVTTTLIHSSGPAILGDESYRIYDVQIR